MSEPAKAVFLSYASQDAEAARRICDALRAGGIEVWFDQNELVGGDQWDAKIRGQITACALFVPVISANTQARDEGYFRLEWKLAVDRSHLMAHDRAFLLPVVIDTTPDASARVPAEFRAVQWTRLPGGETPAAFVGRVSALLDPSVAPPMPPGSPRPARRDEGVASPTKANLPMWAWAALAVVIVGAAGYFATRQVTSAPIAMDSKGQAPSAKSTESAAPKSGALDPHRIAVLPLDNFSVDANDEYLASGLTQELISCLSNISGLEVTPRLSSDRMKKSGKSLPEIGSELRVGTILQGSVRKAGNQLRISVQLIDVSSQRNLWSRDHTTVFDQNIFKMQSDVAEDVASALQVKLLGSEAQRLRKEPTTNIEAYQLFLKGGFHLAKYTEEGTRKARDFFNQALAKDPDFALAYTGLAVAYDPGAAPRTIWPEAEKAARKAIALDDTLADAHLALGKVKLDFEWNWVAAEAEFKRALALKPNLSYAHDAYANFLSMMGRAEEAIAAAKRAEQLDPTSVAIIGGLCSAYGFARKYDQCLEAGLKCIELAPDFSFAHAWVGWAYALQGKWTEARAAFLKAAQLERTPFAVWSIGCCDAMAGRTDDARRALRELEQFSQSRWVSGKFSAAIHVYLGEKEQALTLLEKAYDERDDYNTMLKVDPIWDRLRGEPRFQALMKKMAFDP